MKLLRDTMATLTTLPIFSSNENSLKEHCMSIHICEYECSLWQQYYDGEHRVGRTPLKLEDYLKTPEIDTLINNYKNWLRLQPYERLRIEEIEKLYSN